MRRIAEAVRSIPGVTAQMASLRHLVLGLIALVLVTIAVMMIVSLWALYSASREGLEHRLTLASQLLEENARRNFQAADLVLRLMADEQPFARADHDPEMEDWLRGRIDELPHVRALFIIGADGFITQDSDHPHTPRVSLADRSYFQFHRDSAYEGPHVAPPIQSRSVGKWFVPVSRRINDDGGEFIGVAVAAVEPDFYGRLYERILPESEDAIGLWHADGTLIARYPQDYGYVGRQIPRLELFTLTDRADRGLIRGESPYLPGQQRVLAYVSPSDLPIVVTASSSLQPIMRYWWWITAAAALTFAVLSILSFLTASIAFRRVAEREVLQRRKLMLLKSEALGRMAGETAHDFNNILAATQSGVAMIRRNVSDPGKVQKTLSAMDDTIERGAALTSRLLRFARGRDEDPMVEDLRVLLRKLEPMLHQAVGARNHLAFYLEEGLPPVSVDRTNFDAAILNLVVNARDAMGKIGGRVTISASPFRETKGADKALPKGSYVLITVSDTGPGVPQEVAAHIFEPFYTTKGEMGTGLGLSQVHGFLRDIGGDVRLSVSSSGGAAFELYFPAACRQEGGGSSAKTP